MDLPLSHPVKRALAFGAEEAELLRHRHIGAEHLLLGLLRERDSTAARILERYGFDVKDYRHELKEGRVEPDPKVDDVMARIQLLEEQTQGPHIGRFPFATGAVGSGMTSGGGGGGGAIGAGGKVQDGAFSSSRREGDAVIVETHHFHHGHEVVTTERMQLTEDGRKLSFSIEVTGPGHHHRHTMEFDVS